MARPLRIQYPGAVYHVTARGSRGQAIFADDQDRERFLETLAEACQRTGWRVHAYVLMGNHYHLLIETPEGNLVTGMKWLQSAYTQRYNWRHKVFGHLFQGRYKAVIVDEREPMYFQVVSTYIHLNPARAGLPRIGQQRLKTYRWSSYGFYLNGGTRKPLWLERRRVMGSLGFDEKQGKGYEAYMEGRVLELGRPSMRKPFEEQWKALRRGWYVGGDSFVKRLTEGLKAAARGRRRESQSGPARRAHDEAAAELHLRKGMRMLGLNEKSLKALVKGSPEKAVLAWWLRENTTVTVRWVSERLKMGHYTRVTQAISRVARQPSRRQKALKQKLMDLND
ncbi:MAG: transposase [Limisphaerales bacterium]